ncbi:hypothetical protein B0T10DRAFT_274827 [Thelonectria olida]|uniref:Uncharacterized protein n=1 Tax=Thelonectria olida TaxID=1576542 RepID=A0A9P8WC31_9HYPO|nr:hypothetical protein B0T10DRAFT_274827 [Thelonectria olida]
MHRHPPRLLPLRTREDYVIGVLWGFCATVTELWLVLTIVGEITRLGNRWYIAGGQARADTAVDVPWRITLVRTKRRSTLDLPKWRFRFLDSNQNMMEYCGPRQPLVRTSEPRNHHSTARPRGRFAFGHRAGWLPHPPLVGQLLWPNPKATWQGGPPSPRCPISSPSMGTYIPVYIAIACHRSVSNRVQNLGRDEAFSFFPRSQQSVERPRETFCEPRFVMALVEILFILGEDGKYRGFSEEHGMIPRTIRQREPSQAPVEYHVPHNLALPSIQAHPQWYPQKRLAVSRIITHRPHRFVFQALPFSSDSSSPPPP